MKFALLSIAFAAGMGVSALAVKRDVCFTLNTNLGYISTDTNGYNTIGVSLNGPTQYCLSANTLSVQNGPECLVDATANQRFQCYDFDGIVSRSNFSIADNQDLLYNGCPNFYACSLVGGSYSVYADSAANTGNCTKVNIQMAGFSKGGESSAGSPTISSIPASLPLTSTPITVTPFLSSTSIPLTSTSITVTPFIPPTSIPLTSTPITVTPFIPTSTAIATSTTASSTTGGVTCPTDLSNGAIGSNLFVHVSSSDVDYTSGSSPNITITPDQSSLLSFDVPVTYTDTCALLFMFPFSSSLNASNALNPYEFSGSEEEEGENGGLVISLLDGEINSTTTYATKPAVAESYGVTKIEPGNSYTIKQFLCQWGETSYEIDSAGGVSLIYDQDKDSSSIGLFIVHCTGSSG